MENEINEFEFILYGQELRFLIQSLGGGWIYGLDEKLRENPAEDQVGEKVLIRLIDLGIVVKNDSGQLQVDDLLIGMVYSLIHAQSVVIVSEALSKTQEHFYFLPDWQMRLSYTAHEDQYKLTLFKDRSYVVEQLIDFVNEYHHINKEELFFIVGEKDLELAAQLFVNGQTETAYDVIDSTEGAKFLEDFAQLVKHWKINVVNNIHQSSSSSKRFAIFETRSEIYWVLFDTVRDDEVVMLINRSSTSEIKQQTANIIHSIS